MKRPEKYTLILCAIIVLAFILRVFNLHLFPAGISHDEMDYLVTAKSIYHTGTDTSGTWRVWSLDSPASKTVALAELPSLLMAIPVGMISHPLFAKFGYALISTLMVAVWIRLATILFTKRIGLVTGILLAVNPWAIHFGRTAYESPLAVFFYSLGILLFLDRKIPRAKPLAVVSFLLGFMMYHGSKLLFLPIFLLTLTFLGLYERKRYSLKQMSLMATIGVGFFIVFVTLIVPRSALGNRESELIFSNLDGSIASQVNMFRTKAIPTKFDSLIINKFTLLGQQIIDNYVQAFNIKTLFITGEPLAYLGFMYHGYFYLIELGFLVFGILSAWNLRSKRGLFLIVGIVLLAPLGSALSNQGQTYVLRSAFLYPSLLVFIAFGVVHFLELVPSRLRKLSLSLIVLIYAVSVFHFLHLYFYRYPVYASEAFSLTERIVARYAKLAQENNIPVRITTNESRSLLEQYAYFSGMLNSKDGLNEFSALVNSDTQFTYQNMLIRTDCPEGDIDPETVVIDWKLFECDYTNQDISQGRRSAVMDAATAGVVYRITNDRLCEGIERQPYPLPKSVHEYDIENLLVEELCHYWISVN